MIDYSAINCSSGLYDSCGVVFRYDGRVFRALYSRGVNLFELLTQDGWIDRLTSLGLVPMRRADLTIAGYDTIIECETIRPVIPPSMWTIGMVREAGLMLCTLCKETLTHRLVIWDLKGLSNMAFCAKRGPVFLDLGAIHTIEELENRRLSTSVGALLDQIATSFYVPLWLAYSSPARFRITRRLLEFLRAQGPSSELAVAILRRLTMHWMAVPDLLKAGNLLHAGRYAAFFDLIQNRITRWYHKPQENPQAAGFEMDTRMPIDKNHGKITEIAKGALSRFKGRVCLDLNPGYGLGLEWAKETASETYLITADTQQADGFFSLREKYGKAFLPILCDIWERSSQPSSALAEGFDIALLLPDIFEIATRTRVPLDFMGKVLSSVTKAGAIIGVRRSFEKSEFPAFVSPPPGCLDPVQFVKETVGKYFAKHEVIERVEGSDTAVVLFTK